MEQEAVTLPLSRKEAEAIMWGLAQIGDYLDREPTDPADPLRRLLDLGYTRESIGETCEGLFAVAYGDWLASPLTSLEGDILRMCVESTSWVAAYSLEGISTTEARTTLRSLAAKLDKLGIDINHIPNN
jgi:hypothetical protein